MFTGTTLSDVFGFVWLVGGAALSAFCGFAWLRRRILHAVPILYGALSYLPINAFFWHQPWSWPPPLAMALLFYGFGWIGFFEARTGR